MKEWDADFHLRSPLFAPLSPAWQRLACRNWPELADYDRMLAATALTNKSGIPIKFVAQQQKTSQKDYELRTYHSGEILTRGDNWHDFFNALVWFTYPLSKREINCRHVIPATAGGRSAWQNALTHFDESGLIVASSCETLTAYIENFEWKKLFRENCEKTAQQMEFFIFGHGLYEKALAPYIGMTGHALLLRVEPSFFAKTIEEKNALIDEIVAQRLQEISSPAELSPVPLLGYPGWHNENSEEAFYDNRNYFRGKNSCAAQPAQS